MRGYLNERSVLAIFAERPQGSSAVSGGALCQALATKFRVSRKTVRDIWNRKSWLGVTAPFCTDVNTHSNLSLLDPDSDRESSTSPSSHDPFVNFAAAVDTAPPNLQAVFAERAAALLQDSTPTSLLDDIEELSCSSHQDPFYEEWKFTMTGIDMKTMVTSHNISDGKACEELANTDSRTQAPLVQVSDWRWEVEPATERQALLDETHFVLHFDDTLQGPTWLGVPSA